MSARFAGCAHCLNGRGSAGSLPTCASRAIADSLGASTPRWASVRECPPDAVVTGQAERLPTGHEDVLTAAVVERFPGESAIESFEAQARDVEEPQPFVLGCPPERSGSTIIQGDVDSVIADAVVVGVRQGGAGVRVGMLAVYGGCDVMVEGERVPGEAAVRPKRCRDPVEA